LAANLVSAWSCDARENWDARGCSARVGLWRWKMEVGCEKWEGAGDAGLDPATPATATSSTAKRVFLLDSCKYQVLVL
jgi:hypothetical protein